MTRSSIRLGLLGCGTVGTGVLRLLAEHGSDHRARLGCELEVKAIAVRDPSRTRDDVVPADLLCADPLAVATSDEVDVVVELMGGLEPAGAAVAAALRSDKQVVTANKALLADRGDSLFALAVEHGVDLHYEASVGGGVPVIRALRESLASDRVERIHAITNGTSNYVLTRMEHDGVDLETAVKDAQAKGYAEADPSADVDGLDAECKLRILMALAFGLPLEIEGVDVSGIGGIHPVDFQAARDFGYRIKPLAVARRAGDAIDAWVGPALIPADHVLASVGGVLNAFGLHSDALGPLLLSGQGAGMMATAVSVVSDLIEVGRNLLGGTSGQLPPLAYHRHLRPAGALAKSGDRRRPHLLRTRIPDRPGVLARVARALGENGVSIRRMVQHEPTAGATAELVLLTHTASVSAVRAAVTAIDATDIAVTPTHVLPVEDPTAG